MNLNKQLLIAFSILSALCATYSIPVTANPLEKVLTLSLGPPNTGTFKISSNAPLVTNETSLRLKIGSDLLEHVTVEQLQKVRAGFNIFLADGTIVRKELRVGPTFPQEEVVHLSKLIVNVNGYVIVNGDSQLLHPRGVHVAYNFQTVAKCSVEIQIDQATDHPEIRRIVIAPQIAPKIGLREEIIAKVSPGTSLFSANIGYFGTTHGTFPGAKLEVIRENSSLILRKNDSKGNWYDFYIFDYKCIF